MIFIRSKTLIIILYYKNFHYSIVILCNPNKTLQANNYYFFFMIIIIIIIFLFIYKGGFSLFRYYCMFHLCGKTIYNVRGNYFLKSGKLGKLAFILTISLRSTRLDSTLLSYAEEESIKLEYYISFEGDKFLENNV